MTQRVLFANGAISRVVSSVARSVHSLDQVTGQIAGYQLAGYINGGGAVSAGFTPVVDTLYAVPIVCSRGGAISNLRVSCSTLGAGSSVRMGIYKATSRTNLYPNALVVDAGAVSTATTGTKIVATGMGISLEPAVLYWACLVSTGTSAAFRGGDLPSMWPIFGISSAMGTAPGVGLSVAFTYAALPSTFPSGAAVITAAPIPAISYLWTA